MTLSLKGSSALSADLATLPLPVWEFVAEFDVAGDPKRGQAFAAPGDDLGGSQFAAGLADDDCLDLLVVLGVGDGDDADILDSG